MDFPDFLKPYRKKAEHYLSQGQVGDIEFSGGTYQIQIFEDRTREEIWAFLQLDHSGKIKDCFCSCEHEGVSAYCPHIAAAYLRIYQNSDKPLHQRFTESLWNHLCFLFAEKFDFQTNEIKKEAQGTYKSSSITGKLLFYIQAKEKNAELRLKQIFEQKKRETEETSLKFSNLSSEEIVLWKEGRPSSQLRYELSSWSDLAKWLFFMQERGDLYQISFELSEKKLPQRLSVDFPQISATFYLSQANLPSIIPSLATVQSPLAVHTFEEEYLAKIRYDKKEKCLFIETLPHKTKKPYEGDKISPHAKKEIIPGWLYVEGDGFHAKEMHSLLSKSKIEGEEISKAFNENFSLISKYLTDEEISNEEIPVSYEIAFDASWNLHIDCYAFKPGDLTKPDSAYFGNWAYIDGEGFYRLEGVMFPEMSTIIQETDLSDFVSQYRSWLNHQEGFHTHLATIESQLTYKMSDQGLLTFESRVSVASTSEKHHDFGTWIYIAGQGFYSKFSGHIGLPLRSGASFKGDQIPLFIRMNREELKLVPGFFAKRNPIIRAGIRVTLDKNEKITLIPQYELLSEYQQARLQFFDDFVYCPGEGFSELSTDKRLPEDFRQSVVLEDPEEEALFLTYQLETLNPYISFIDPRLERPHDLQLVIDETESSEELEKKGWVNAKISYYSEKGNVAVTTLLKAIKKKKRFVFSEAGLIDLHEERFKWLKQIKKDRLQSPHAIALSTLDILKLNALEKFNLESFNQKKAPQSTREFLYSLLHFVVPDHPDLSGLKSPLRPYQNIGVEWLWFLYHHRLSGLLCDDMGLGKTHQAMALLAAVHNKLILQKIKPKYLVICPTSVIYHWQDKLSQYLPEAKICTFYGQKRKLEKFQETEDILLTSYGVWRNESELLSAIPFEVAILDEIQVAKNYTSMVHQSLLNIQAKMKIGLTGTPIENYLRELKSLFDIVLPHYMPTEEDYREFFIKPIERDHNPEKKELLSRYIKPFLLRRKKEDVLEDLPEKTEEIAYCELLPEQRKLYKEALSQAKPQIMEELKDESKPIPFVHIFALLSHLKQICNHPALYLKKTESYLTHSSGKWELFLELLQEATESQQKVVVFSHFLGMLDIIESHLTEAGIEYASVRGSTTDRKEQLKKFQNDPRCQVFVGSLQAVGLGVDLTAASVVIHYDRWWNAARENQATDRVHRIGQSRGVQVFKLVTKGTFEEKIHELIVRKARLMEEVIGTEEHLAVKRFTRSEIIELLQLVESH